MTFKRLFAAFLVSTFLALPASVQAKMLRSAHSQAELAVEFSEISRSLPFHIGLFIKPDPGWHTYWRNAGDSGAAPILKWRHSDDLKLGETRWPFPERIKVGPLANYGYSGEMLLIVPARLSNASAGSEKIELKAEWLVCQIDCIPAYGSFLLDLPVRKNPKPNPSWKNLFSRFQNRLPQKSEDWSFEASQQNGKIRLSIQPPPGAEAFQTAEFFPYDQLVIENSAEQRLEREGENRTLTLSIAPEALTVPRRLRGILVVNQKSAYELDVPVTAALSGLGPLLVLAFMGGLLLNLMPCVFPVLSIKVLGFLEHSQSNQSRLHGLAFASGILASFWVLAGILLLLRAQGERLGWGFQLQSPVFLIGLAALFIFLGLNLLGLFEIGSGWMRLGGLASETRGLRRSFFSGALAAVVATPCTAPFMGTAIGAALALPATAALGIFTSLALGMSFPYAALTFYPSGLKWLPRPGPWMETLKQALAFPLFATSVWLLWVLGRQLSLPWLGQGSAALWAASLFLWAWRRFGSLGARALAGAISALGIGAVLLSSPAPALSWEPYSEESLRAHLLQKRDVFVNFTAAWCVTCQVNERIAFRNPQARQALKRPGLALLKADWTSRDPKITAALENLGRSGVPVYALFSPDAPPKILSAVLTPGILVEALEKKK